MASYSYKCSNDECPAPEQSLTAPMSERDAWQGKVCLTCGNGHLHRIFTPWGILRAGLGDIL